MLISFGSTFVCFFLIFRSLGALGNPRLLNCQLSLPQKSFPKQSKMDDGHCDFSRGSLIVLEGLDRCGKTSQSSRLVTYLEGKGFSVESWRFPDRSTGVGELISSYLSSKTHLDDHTVHLLFSANRWEKRSSMESKLKSGTTLVVDRYAYSGVAFSAAKGLDFDWCKAQDRGLLAPDAVVYLDILPEKAAQRGGYGGERYEQLEFQRKVAEQYAIIRDDTWKVIDACCPTEDVEQQIRELARECINKCRKGKPFSLLWSQSSPSQCRT